jgi:hypothetical protein
MEKGLLYLGLHNQLVKKYGSNATISRKDFLIKVGRHFILPKNLRCFVINEMEKLNLISKENRNSLKLLPYEMDLEEHQHKVLEKLNLI